MSPFVMAGSVSTSFPALGAVDQGANQGLLDAIGDDAWLIIPFVLGFIAFGSPWGKLFEQMMGRFCDACGFSKEAGLPSTWSARLAGAFESRAPKEDLSSAGAQPELVTIDVEYLAVSSELSAIRSEILRERGSISVA